MNLAEIELDTIVTFRLKSLNEKYVAYNTNKTIECFQSCFVDDATDAVTFFAVKRGEEKLFVVVGTNDDEIMQIMTTLTEETNDDDVNALYIKYNFVKLVLMIWLQDEAKYPVWSHCLPDTNIDTFVVLANDGKNKLEFDWTTVIEFHLKRRDANKRLDVVDLETLHSVLK